MTMKHDSSRYGHVQSTEIEVVRGQQFWRYWMDHSWQLTVTRWQFILSHGDISLTSTFARPIFDEPRDVQYSLQRIPVGP